MDQVCAKLVSLAMMLQELFSHPSLAVLAIKV
jgi:hypothetical protein